MFVTGARPNTTCALISRAWNAAVTSRAPKAPATSVSAPCHSFAVTRSLPSDLRLKNRIVQCIWHVRSKSAMAVRNDDTESIMTNCRRAGGGVMPLPGELWGDRVYALRTGILPEATEVCAVSLLVQHSARPELLARTVQWNNRWVSLNYTSITR